MHNSGNNQIMVALVFTIIVFIVAYDQYKYQSQPDQICISMRNYNNKIITSCVDNPRK